VLVVILLLLFLGNLRAAIVVAVTLPLAALFTFILMSLFGMSANLMSLGGLASPSYAGGRCRGGGGERGFPSRHDQSSKNIPHLHVIYRAVKEVVMPVASGVVIIIVVFLPLLTLQGLEGKLFIPVALTIIFALAGSLILSLTRFRCWRPIC